jgi:hypothetical protein
MGVNYKLCVNATINMDQIEEVIREIEERDYKGQSMPAHNKNLLRQQFHIWLKHAEPGNWASQKLEQFGFVVDYNVWDHGTEPNI